jgi:hypothetical protein
MKLQGDKSGRKGHLSVATEVMIALWQTTADALAIFDNFLQYQRSQHDLVPWLDQITNSCLWLQVFEVAPSLHMVELRKTGGDTLEFHKACEFLVFFFINNLVF